MCSGYCFVIHIYSRYDITANPSGSNTDNISDSELQSVGYDTKYVMEQIADTLFDRSKNWKEHLATEK